MTFGIEGSQSWDGIKLPEIVLDSLAPAKLKQACVCRSSVKRFAGTAGAPARKRAAGAQSFGTCSHTFSRFALICGRGRPRSQTITWAVL